MGLANWLTVLRILLVPIFVSLLVYRRPRAALLVFALAAVTDLLDGYVARAHGLSTRLGAFLDPLADKLLLTTSFITLTYLKALPFWIAAVAITRDVLLIIGALLIHMMGGRISPRPTWAGKAATFFQILTVLTGLSERHFRVSVPLDLVIWPAAIFTVASGLQYIVQGMRQMNTSPSDDEEEPSERLLLP